jgi:hypothetical protein
MFNWLQKFVEAVSGLTVAVRELTLALKQSDEAAVADEMGLFSEDETVVVTRGRQRK